MLRVCTPGSIHNHCEGRIRSPLRQDVATELRKHIIGMVKESCDDIHVQDVNMDESGLIYQIKKKGSIAPIPAVTTKEDKQNERIKKNHLKILKSSYGRGSHRFPFLDGDHLSKEFSNLQDDPLKDRNASAKSVRFKLENKNMNSADSPPGYEVRGNAIKSSSGFHKSVPLILRRTEAAQRQAHIHNSLQVFKRRLKFNNQGTYLAPNSNVRESDYIIRRVPLQLDHGVGLQIPNAVPLAPRLSVSSKLHARPNTPNKLSASKTSNRPNTPNRPHTPGENTPKRAQSTNQRPKSGMSQKDSGDEKKVKYSYRLPDNLSFGKEVSFRDETEAIPNVNTYVVEQFKTKTGKKYETQAMLNEHNLGVHDALHSANENKVQIDSDTEVDHRLVRWVEESTSINFTKRINRIRSASSERYGSPSSARFRSGSVESRDKVKFLTERTQSSYLTVNENAN